jgi:hypothetical protein
MATERFALTQQNDDKKSDQENHLAYAYIHEKDINAWNLFNALIKKNLL